MGKIRLGFVGVGGMGQGAHLHNYVNRNDCEVVAVAELRPKMRAGIQSRWNIPKAYPDHKAMLAAEKLDGIVAIQPFSLHGQLIPELLAYGKPVLTEKPIARSTEAADRILAAEKMPGAGKLYVAYHKRSDPATVWAKHQITALQASGELGKMRFVRAVMPPGDWVGNGFNMNLFTDDEAYHGKVAWDPAPAGMSEMMAKEHEAFVNYYIHQVNLLRHLLGESYQVAWADPNRVTMAVRSDSGVSGNLEMATFNTSRDWQESALVCFERGWISLELPCPLTINRPGRVRLFKDPGKGAEPVTIEPTLPMVHAMRGQADNFLAAIRGEKTDLCGAADAKADIGIADQWVRQVQPTAAKKGA